MKARWAIASLLGLGLASCSMISCPHRQPATKIKQMTLEEAAARIEKEGGRRERVSGLFKARLGGLKGIVASADLDVIAEEPARLHLAVRSFFSQPMKVLATDGERVTVFDAQGEGGPRFFEGPATEHSAEMLLGVPLSVPEVVNVLLAKPPPGAKPIAHAIDDSQGQFSVVYDLARGGRATVTAGAQDVIVDVAVTAPNGAPRFSLHYDEIEMRSGIAFAERIEIRVILPQGEEVLVLTARDITLNGEPFGDEVFSVGLPPGSHFEPLPGTPLSPPLGQIEP